MMKAVANPDRLTRILDVTSFVGLMAGFALLIGAYFDADLRLLSLPAIGMTLYGLLHGTRWSSPASVGAPIPRRG